MVLRVVNLNLKYLLVYSRQIAWFFIRNAGTSYYFFAGSHPQRFTYTGEELEYFYFVHAISIVGRVLMYKQGLKLFPVRVKGYEGTNI